MKVEGPLPRCLLEQLWVASSEDPRLQLVSWARRMELKGPWLLVLDGLEAGKRSSWSDFRAQEERENMELLPLALL